MKQQSACRGERRGLQNGVLFSLERHPDVTAFATDGCAKSPLYLGSSAIFD